MNNEEKAQALEQLELRLKPLQQQMVETANCVSLLRRAVARLEKVAFPMMARSPDGVVTYVESHTAVRELASLKRELETALDLLPGAVRVREGGGLENLGASVAVNLARAKELDSLRTEARLAISYGKEGADLLRFVRQTVHQAHHNGPIEACSINSCVAIAKHIGERG